MLVNLHLAVGHGHTKVVLKFLGVVFHQPALSVKLNQPFGRLVHVGNDKGMFSKEFSPLLFHLADYPARISPTAGLVLKVIVQGYVTCGRRSQTIYIGQQMRDILSQDVVLF